MAQAASSSVVHQIASLFESGSVSGLSDRQILERFVSRRDAAAEAAFAALVARHGPMVLLVCRRLVGDYQHAEDTFQAVFLVLARRARSVRDPELLSHWLYGVSLRTARKAKVRLARQRKNERGNAMSGASLVSGDTADRSVIDREQEELLHDEIERLPRDFRLPIVLCYFEGLPLDEAARRLRWREGTLRSRLARARDKLRRGLTRRGMVLPAAAIASVLDARPVAAALSSPLCVVTARASIDFAARPATAGAESAPAFALAREVLRSMVLQKLKLTKLALLVIGAIASGAGFVGQAPLRQAGKPEPTQIATKPDDDNPKPAPSRMFVLGHVLDPTGKPVPNATTMVYARSKALGNSPSLSRMLPIPVGDARADGSGRFHLDAPRTSSSRYDTFGAVAIAPGYGVGWVELDPNADQPAADIILRSEHVIRGRLFDIQGRPATGVTISVWQIRPLLPKVPPLPVGRAEGVGFWWTNDNIFPAWPKPATTDAEGRFTVRGVGRNLRVFLTARHQRFALQQIEVETDGASESKPITLALEPAKVITGRVIYADTGKPVPHAHLAVVTRNRRVPDFEADADGRFRINPPSGDRYNVTAWPSAGQPYLTLSRRLDWPKSAVEQSLDLALPRGISVHGTVTEEGSGQPIAGAQVRFIARPARQGNAGSRSGSGTLDTAADGSFQFGALPSPGYLSIMAPSDDYVLQAISKRRVNEGQPGGIRYYSHASMLLDLKPGIGDKEIHVTLRRGVTVRGQVVGPDGQPVRNARMISRIIMPPAQGHWKTWLAEYHDDVHDGHFQVHGLAPDAEVPVHFLDPKRKFGATGVFSGKSAAGGPATVRLEPCGSAKARLVNPDGKPVAGRLQPHTTITMVVTPGSFGTPANENAGRLAADEASLNRVDPTNYQNLLASDADGRVTLPVLIPGAMYRFVDLSTLRDPIGPQLRKEFTVKAGETLDLGDILVEKPGS